METPNVPEPHFKTRVKANAYPVREEGGLVWAYLGPPESKPAFPHYPWFYVPDSNRINAYAVDNCMSSIWMASAPQRNSKISTSPPLPIWLSTPVQV
jgi:hypothetical protein